MIRVDHDTSVVLTLVEQSVAANELLVKHHHHLVVGATDHGTSHAEGHVLPHHGVHVQDAVSHFEVAGGAVAERRSPVREPLREDHVGLERLHISDFQRDVVEVFLDLLAVSVQAFHDAGVQRIKAHLNVGQLTDGQ